MLNHAFPPANWTKLRRRLHFLCNRDMNLTNVYCIIIVNVDRPVCGFKYPLVNVDRPVLLCLFLKGDNRWYRSVYISTGLVDY